MKKYIPQESSKDISSNASLAHAPVGMSTVDIIKHNSQGDKARKPEDHGNGLGK